MKCKKCGENVKGKRIIKHMWAAHRALMMKNHKGGFGRKKKTEAPEDDRLEQQRDAVMDLVGPAGTRPAVAAARGETHLRSKFLANGKKLTVVVHQGQNQIELSNVTLVEMFE